MSKRLIYALSILTVLTGCFRDESHLNKTCISGCAMFNVHVTTGDNTTPVGGVNVHMIWQGPGDGLFPGASIDVAKGYTDAKGIVNFKFKAAGNEFVNGYFMITVNGPADYLTAYRSIYDIHSADTILNTSVHLPALASMKIVFKNFDPKTSNDVFEVLPSFKTYGSTTDPVMPTSSAQGNYTNNLFYTNQTAPFDSLIYTSATAGNQYTYFQVLIKRNGIRIDHVDSIYIPKGTVGTYRVDYQHSFQ